MLCIIKFLIVGILLFSSEISPKVIKWNSSDLELVVDFKSVTCHQSRAVSHIYHDQQDHVDFNGNQLYTLQWRHNGRDGVSNHQPYDVTQPFIQADQSSASLAFVRGIPRTNGQ